MNDNTNGYATVWKCMSCGNINEDRDCFCVNCGAKNKSKWFCRSCGQVNDSDALFCISCGKKQELYSDKKEGALPSKSNQKNKRLTIAFIIVFIVFLLITGILCVFTQGLINNILITLTSCLFPAAIGIGLNFLGNAFRNNKGVQRFLHIFGSVFYCFCPVLLLFTVFYNFSFHVDTDVARPMTIIIAFSLSFFGYIPAHYNKHYSLMKNNVLGVINLFSIAFMWSFVSGEIAVPDALFFAKNVLSITYKSDGFIVLFFKASSILILLQALKLIIEEFDDISILKKKFN